MQLEPHSVNLYMLKWKSNKDEGNTEHFSISVFSSGFQRFRSSEIFSQRFCVVLKDLRRKILLFLARHQKTLRKAIRVYTFFK